MNYVDRRPQTVQSRIIPVQPFDYVVFGADVLERGDAGVRAAGWFDHGWRLASASAISGR